MSVVTVGVLIYAQSDSRKIDATSVVLITSAGCRTAETRTVGTIIKDGYVLTVAHGVAGQASNQVTTATGKSFQATVVAIDTDQDIALLKLDPTAEDPEFVELNFAEAKQGEKISFVAFDDQQQVIREARVTRRLKINTEDIYLQKKVSRPGLEVELQVEIGNSGGPLINKSGQLVGIVWSTSRIVKNRSWATRVEAVDQLFSPELDEIKVVACSK